MIQDQNLPKLNKSSSLADSVFYPNDSSLNTVPGMSLDQTRKISDLVESQNISLFKKEKDEKELSLLANALKPSQPNNVVFSSLIPVKTEQQENRLFELKDLNFSAKSQQITLITGKPGYSFCLSFRQLFGGVFE